MVIHIENGKNNTLEKSKVQSIPFKIHADCEAPISSYFETYVKNTDNVLMGSFRGHGLKGQKIQLPEGYVGVVLHESIFKSSGTDKADDERKFCITNKFKELTFWNWDKFPSKNDPILKAFDWLEIAEALHRPVDEDKIIISKE